MSRKSRPFPQFAQKAHSVFKGEAQVLKASRKLRPDFPDPFLPEPEPGVFRAGNAAAAAVCGKDPFVFQLLVGLLDGIGVDFQPGRRFPPGGQQFPVLEAAGNQQLLHPPDQLRIYRLFPVQLKSKPDIQKIIPFLYSLTVLYP